MGKHEDAMRLLEGMMNAGVSPCVRAVLTADAEFVPAHGFQADVALLPTGTPLTCRVGKAIGGAGWGLYPAKSGKGLPKTGAECLVCLLGTDINDAEGIIVAWLDNEEDVPPGEVANDALTLVLEAGAALKIVVAGEAEFTTGTPPVANVRKVARDGDHVEISGRTDSQSPAETGTYLPSAHTHGPGTLSGTIEASTFILKVGKGTA